jgi:hypothetical protein
MMVCNWLGMDEKHKQLSLFYNTFFCYIMINDENDMPICIIKYILALLVFLIQSFAFSFVNPLLQSVNWSSMDCIKAKVLSFFLFVKCLTSNNWNNKSINRTVYIALFVAVIYSKYCYQPSSYTNMSYACCMLD